MGTDIAAGDLYNVFIAFTDGLFTEVEAWQYLNFNLTSFFSSVGSTTILSDQKSKLSGEMQELC